MVCRHCGHSVLSDNDGMTLDGGEGAFGADGEVDVERGCREAEIGSGRGEARWYCWAGEGRLGVCCRGCWVGSTMLGWEGGGRQEERRMGLDGTGEWEGDGREKSGRRGRGLGVVRRVREEVESGVGCVVC